LANIKSAMKRAKTSEGENLRNRMDKSELKTAVRRFDEALKSGDKEAIETTFVTAVKTVDRSASKGVIHKNAADRKKAQLAKKRNAENN